MYIYYHTHHCVVLDRERCLVVVTGAVLQAALAPGGQGEGEAAETAEVTDMSKYVIVVSV